MQKFVIMLLTFSGLSILTNAQVPHILHYSKVGGFRHTSGIVGCTKMLNELKDEGTITVKHSESEADLLTLDEYDLVIFDNNVNANTSTPGDAPKQAVIDYITNGGRYLGFHGASDHHSSWNWYTTVLYSGARFVGHGGGVFTVVKAPEVDQDPEIKAFWEDVGLGNFVTVDTEKYNFNVQEPIYNLRGDPDVTVLQVLGNSSQTYDDHIFSWTKKIGQGRMVYTGLGHQEDEFTQQSGQWLKKATVGYVKYLMGDYAPPVVVRGCTNPAATNYDSTATEDDGSCIVSINIAGKLLGKTITRVSSSQLEINVPYDFDFKIKLNEINGKEVESWTGNSNTNFISQKLDKGIYSISVTGKSVNQNFKVLIL